MEEVSKMEIRIVLEVEGESISLESFVSILVSGLEILQFCSW